MRSGGRGAGRVEGGMGVGPERSMEDAARALNGRF
jgi:hypothetical protein